MFITLASLLCATMMTSSSYQLELSKVNVCGNHKTCSACVTSSAVCHWCLQRDFSSNHRCDVIDNLIASNCSRNNIYVLDSTLIYHKNEQPRNVYRGQEAVQLSPQNITVKLRPNKVFRFPLTFRLAENYPVDLYFLMDVSRTMRDYKDNLVVLSDRLASELSKLTNSFQLGLGTFVDKTTMPYASMDQVSSWCSDCAPPYGFRNHYQLSDDVSEFKRKVNETEMSGNIDAPEGGFDAIMQAIACKKQIGWRTQSRKLVVLSTDASFHYAGDGKLGGIVEPNDGLCHLNENGEYTESITQDYPSISQLSQKVAEHKIHVIFAVPQVQVPLYTQLVSYIEGSTIGVLTETSSNVVDVVRDNYQRISSSIEMKTEGAGDDIHVSFRSKCLSDVMRDTNKCDGLHIGQSVTFEVLLEVKSCPVEHHLRTQTFQIHPLGLTENLTISVQLNCQCPCETSQYEEYNSGSCSGNGTYECGVCACNDGYYGDKCQCDSKSLIADTHDSACRIPGSNTSEVCQGRGLCVCGKCSCTAISQSEPDKLYTGDYCQCSDYSCDYYKSEICGGSSRGQCVCGVCKCKDGYNGTRCECPTSQERCIASNGKMCNDKGACVCGECQCTAENGFYKGRTCEDCPTCPGKCERNYDCVRCLFRSHDELCIFNCSYIEMVDRLEGGDDWHACHLRDDDYCFIHFAYSYSSDEVKVQRTKECNKPVDIRLIIMGVVVGILAVGVALLFTWKAFVTIHDRREFARFQEESKKARWDVQMNPIYRHATTTYKNPTFIAQNQ